jgi:phosphoglucosamine mutase
MLISKGKLKNKLVVSTVMSNMGLGIALKKLGASLITTKVGDRHVMEEMRSRNACLGGEDSGHIIFSDHHTTGDGLISAFNLLTAVKDSRKKLSELSVFMKVFPQTLVNVPVACKPDIRSVMGISHVLKDVEERLGERGRVLVRYSGTEPLCRVMVEGETEEEVSLFASEIALAIKKEIGGE